MKLSVLWAAFLIAVFAELGCLARNTALFAAQDATLSVFLGLLLGDILLLGISALLGDSLHRVLPDQWIERGAGILFILIGGWMLWHQHSG